jgi:acyl-CoA thioesterase-1
MKKSCLLSVIVLLLSFGALGQDKLLILGDSLTEGYGVNEEYSFPSVLETILKENHFNYKVLNGGVSGSTTASGKSRLRWFLKAKPKVLIIALGANDGLRGIKVSESIKNLEEIIAMAKAKNIKIVLAGMLLPPNYGEKYTSDFKKMFVNLTKKHKLSSIPFLLEGVAGNKDLNIEDGIHPNRKGYQIIAKNVFKQIKDLL